MLGEWVFVLNQQVKPVAYGVIHWIFVGQVSLFKAGTVPIADHFNQCDIGYIAHIGIVFKMMWLGIMVFTTGEFK